MHDARNFATKLKMKKKVFGNLLMNWKNRVIPHQRYFKENSAIQAKNREPQRKVQQRNQEFIRLRAYATRKYEQEGTSSLAVAKRTILT